MSALATKETMLYCPKCKTKYENGNQRFCDDDGGRLLPAATEFGGVKRKSNKVFTTLLSRTAQNERSDEKLAGSPRFVKVNGDEPKFEPPVKSKIFKQETIIKPDPIRVDVDQPLEIAPADGVSKLSGKLIQSSEVSVSQAVLGNRKIDPLGRSAVSWQNPRVLLGETIKGRYRIADKLHQDQASIAYLAEDSVAKGKRVVVRVLMSDTARDSFQDKVFAEERVSLSHINHPNIIRVVDSGELPEGKPFIVTDFIEGKSVADILRRSGNFNSMRAARIIRQSSLALSEIHQSGVLHRNLKPEHILLLVSDAGIEQVKVTDFAVSDGRPQLDNLALKSPEQLGGELPTFASDSYSLAVIAFKMLSGQLPFNDNSERGFLKAQKAGLRINVSDLKPEFSEKVDKIFAKALAFNPSDRYSKTRDFGEALFNALTMDLPREDEARFGEVAPAVVPTLAVGAVEAGKISISSAEKDIDPKAKSDDVTSDIHIASSESIETPDEADGLDKPVPVKIGSGEELWKNRSTDPASEKGPLWTLLWIGIVLILAVAAIWSLLNLWTRGTSEVAVQPTQTQDVESQKPAIEPVADKNVGDDTPPPMRKVKQPPNTAYFANSKDKLSPKLAKHYRRFELYYPNTWKNTPSDTNFLDIKKTNKDGFPEEQMLITHYDSGGTFGVDKPQFPKLVEKSNKDLEGIIPNYNVAGERDLMVNGYRAHAIEFTGTATRDDDSDLQIWGRRIWVPVALPGEQDGFVITMFATSLSESVKSIEDVGQKGDLGEILRTFQPNQEYNN